jgi:membrane associated rhomboid family serine protease
MSISTYTDNFTPAQRLGKGTIFFLIANLAVYVFCIVPPIKAFAGEYLLLNTSAPWLWQAFTYMFFHGDVFHIFFNLLGFFFFAPVVEDHFGTRTFVRYTLACGVGAAILSYLLDLIIPGEIGRILGFSGALYGTMYALYRFMPDAVVHFMMVFPIKLKYLLLAFLIFSLLKILDPSQGDPVAHGAHLGGLLTGFLWFRYTESFMILKAGWDRKQERKLDQQRGQAKVELDRILEKISKEGMGALTRKERTFLNHTSQNFKKKDS